MNHVPNPADFPLRGERVHLRPLAGADATATYVGWLNDPETTRYLESGRRVETIDSIREYIGKYENRPDALFLAIVMNDGDVHVGNIKLDRIDWTHRHATLGIMIGAAEARGKGIGGEATILTLRHAFHTMKLHRVDLGVTQDNLPGIKCYKKIGVVEEGRLRESTLREHGFIDVVWMSVLSHEFDARYPGISN